MQKKWFVLILLTITASLFSMSSVAAEELKMIYNYTAANFIQTDSTNLSDLIENVNHVNWTRSSYFHKPSQRSQKIDFTRYLPFPFEIDALAPTLFDPEVRLGMDPKWREESLSCTFGIKYSFTRFELQDFAKSFLSLFSNMNKDAPKKGSNRALPVSFYLSVPEY